MKTSKKDNSTKLAYLAMVTVLILSILLVILTVSAIRPYFNSLSTKVNSINLGMPYKQSVITTVTILGKNKLEDDKIEVLAYNNQFNEECNFTVNQRIADQLNREQGYLVERATKIGFTGKENTEYSFIVNKEIDGIALADLGIMSQETIDGAIEDLRFDTYTLDGEEVTKYTITVIFSDIGFNQKITTEITEELYNMLYNLEDIQVTKTTYSISGKDTAIRYSLFE